MLPRALSKVLARRCLHGKSAVPSTPGQAGFHSPHLPAHQATFARPRWVPCKFGADIAHYIQQEVVIEGVFHVSAAQASTCLDRFGDLDVKPAPALPTLQEVLANAGLTAHSSSGSSSDRVVNEAFCLATPPDNPGETTSPLRPVQPSTARPAATTATVRVSSSNSGGEGPSMRFPSLRAPARAAINSSALAQEAEELLQFEGIAVTYQYTCLRAAMSAEYANEALQASAAVRRQRRRALIRLLRRSRVLTANSLSALQDSPPAQLLASIGASVSSLSSWEEESAAPASSASNIPSSASSMTSSASNKTCSASNRTSSKRYPATGKAACKRYPATTKARRRRRSSSSKGSGVAWGGDKDRCYGCVYETCKCAAFR